MNYDVQTFIEQNVDLIDNDLDACLSLAQDELNPYSVAELCRILHSANIQINLDKLYPEYDEYRIFDLDRPENLPQLQTVLDKATFTTVLDQNTPITPDIFSKIHDHAYTQDLWFTFKKISTPIHRIQASLRIDKDFYSSYRNTFFGDIKFYDASDFCICVATLDIDYNLFGVYLPEVGYALNLDAAQKKLNKTLNDIVYLNNYFRN